MNELHFTIDINAPKDKVWDIMLSEDTYPQWTGAFHEGSYFVGSWELGSDIKFLSTEDDSQSGILGKVVESRPYEFVSVEIISEIADGEPAPYGEFSKLWAGSHENYSFTEADGVTTVTVDMIGPSDDPEMTEEFARMWPPALQKLKQICEQ